MLETQRLILRRPQHRDLETLAELTADAEVMRFLGDGRTLDRATTSTVLERWLGHWEEHGFGRWAVERKSDRLCVGF